MEKEFAISVKVDPKTRDRLEKCSRMDFNRGIAGIVRRLIADGLPYLEAELAKNPTTLRESLPAVGSKLPPGKRGISKVKES